MSILMEALKKSKRDTALPAREAQEPWESQVPKPPIPTKLPLAGICLTVALTIILLYLGANLLSGKPASSPKPDLNPQPTAPLQPASATQSATAPGPAASAQLQPAPLQESPTPSLPRLEGILWDPEAPLAILEGKPRKVGDSIREWTITTILPDSVILAREGSSQTLYLPTPAANQ